MVSVAQKARWCQSFLERIAKARAKGDRHAVARISGYYRVPVKSAYDWLYKWDGSWRSLVAKSHRPHSHSKAHTEAEIGLMIEVRGHTVLSHHYCCIRSSVSADIAAATVG